MSVPDQTPNLYQRNFFKLRETLSADEAIEILCHRYLDGKPKSTKRPLTSFQRDQDFWTSSFWDHASASVLNSDTFALALTRYLQQEGGSLGVLLDRIVREAPKTLCRAVRYSRVFLHQKSPRWTEVRELAQRYPDDLSDFLQACTILAEEEQEFANLLKEADAVLSDNSLLEVLLFISLIAFKNIIPIYRGLVPNPTESSNEGFLHNFLAAVDAILLRKLSIAPPKDFHLTANRIARITGRHLKPLFFQPGYSESTLETLLRFEELLNVQRAYDDFRKKRLDAFCFDDDYRIHLAGGQLTLYPHELPQYSDWDRDGDKLSRLLVYQHYRSWLSMPALTDGDTWGRPEHEAANYAAWVKASRTQAILHDLYGFESQVTLGNGREVSLMHACLTAEMTSASCQQTIEHPYCQRIAEHGEWRLALTEVMMAGIMAGENRMPLTFMEQKDKAKRIRSYTLEENYPKGRITAAHDVLDFLSLDLKSLAAQLKSGQRIAKPQFWNWPFLKIGNFLFQMPWLNANSNDTNATINRLRRSGARRSEQIQETHRIEQRLAAAFAEREFMTVVGYTPPDDGPVPAGEVDLIVARDGWLIIMEIKSGYVRSSQAEAWYHRTNTLRKAGLQLKRKVCAVRAALQHDSTLRQRLGFASVPEKAHSSAWIVDTSIEWDHQRFSGFLKISLEEVLIALRDEAILLRDIAGLFTTSDQWKQAAAPLLNADILLNKAAEMDAEIERVGDHDKLYTQGFSADKFVDVIESEKIWRLLDEDRYRSQLDSATRQKREAVIDNIKVQKNTS